MEDYEYAFNMEGTYQYSINDWVYTQAEYLPLLNKAPESIQKEYQRAIDGKHFYHATRILCAIHEALRLNHML